MAFLKHSIVNSLVLFVWTMIFGSAVAILFSYYVFKKRFGHIIFKVFLFLPQILGGVVVVIMYKYFMDEAVPVLAKLLGWEMEEGLIANPATQFASILFYSIYTGFGIQVLVYSSTMSGISDSIIESAQLDGITPIKELIFIVIPSIWETFITFMVASVVGIFTNQMSLYTFFGDKADHSLYTFGYYLYKQVLLAGNNEYPYLSAMGFLLTVIAIPLTLFTRWALTKFGPRSD
ncbi:MAG: sugar ABC transporter permease [Clostridia bacterium]|nr:sugar ABC transporter permease [Clostridia bacterium]